MNYSIINKNYSNAKKQFEKNRMSEVSRIANQLQKQGLTRTEALKVAEKMIPM